MGELEVDQLAGLEIAEQEVEFANGGVDVRLNLEVAGEEVVSRRGVEQGGERVFADVGRAFV